MAPQPTPPFDLTAFQSTMTMSSNEFLERACSWAFEHGTMSIDDDDFLPEIKREGLSEASIIRLKTDLERRGVIENHHVIGGMRDFRLNRATFLQRRRHETEFKAR